VSSLSSPKLLTTSRCSSGSRRLESAPRCRERLKELLSTVAEDRVIASELDEHPGVLRRYDEAWPPDGRRDSARRLAY
jgi:hypothetical protein